MAGFWKWKELGRFVKKGEKGIPIVVPIIGVRLKKNEEGEKDITKQNAAVLVGFRSTYVFDVSETEGAELPELREISGDAGENRDRLIVFLERQGIELVFSERIAPPAANRRAPIRAGRRFIHRPSTGFRVISRTRALGRFRTER